MIYFSFSSSWLWILLIPAVIFAAVFIYRKGYRKKSEMKQQLAVAAISMGMSFFIEYLGVTLDLWHYVGGDWPVILWLIYLTGAFAGFQIVKLITEKVR